MQGDSPEKSSSVCAIVFRGSEVLLIKRRDIPVWVLPGGGLDPGEPPEEGALRELFEESGFKGKIVRKVAEYLPVNKMTRFTHFFECEIIGGAPCLGPETLDVSFFPIDKLPFPLIPPPYPYWIQDAAALHPHVLRKPVEGVNYLTLLKLFLQHPILVGRFLLTKLGIHINTR